MPLTEFKWRVYRKSVELCIIFTDDDTIGKIVNAITATTEPKISSSVLLKKYIIDYHPEFHIDQRPHSFAKALERAINNNIIRYRNVTLE